MSGPITAGYFVVHGLIFVSAEALREAQAIRREFAAVNDQLQARADGREAARAAGRQAKGERANALRSAAVRAEARLARLGALAQSLVAAKPELVARLSQRPAPPVRDAATSDWATYLAALEGIAAELEALLAAAGRELGAKLAAAAGAPQVAGPSLDEVLATYARARAAQPGLDARQADEFRANAARALSRLELGPGEDLPPALEELARAIVLAPTPERAEALALELRHAVHRLQAERKAALGQAEAAAAALVLEHSLRDLGYEVEDIDATLFATGGTVHFRRAGWDDYFVRMRIDTTEHTANFNVVRPRGPDESAERRRRDTLAEDRWCADFPRLLQTLAARGLKLDVTRRLAAGELPVQVVDAASLPAVREEADDTTHTAPAQARPLP